MRDVIVFLGPTLPIGEARAILDATYFPPAAQGDVISAVVNDRPKAIALIDGATMTSNAVWPKELLFALEKGVVLFGAAAHGALRAVEIPGMRGIGEVYRQFAAGEMEADDEVERVWRREESAYVAESLSLINIRASLNLAVREKRLPADAAEVILKAAARMFFPQRTAEALARIAGRLGVGVAQVTLETLTSRHVDVQALDAAVLLRQLASGEAFEGLNRSAAEPARKSLFFHRLYDEDRKVWSQDTAVPLYALRNEVALTHPQAEDVFFTAGLRRAGVEYAKRLGLRPRDEAVDAERGRFRRSRDLEEDDAFLAWLKENDLPEEDFHELMAELATLRTLLGARCPRTRDALDELRLRGEYPEWKARTAQTEQALEQCRDQALDLFNNVGQREALQRYLRRRLYHWGVSAMAMGAEAGMDRDSLAWELAKRAAIDEAEGAPPLESLLGLLGD